MASLVIWDWNGTLLNDMDACIRSMNRMLEKRRLPPIDFETYRNVFTFPVVDYYRAVGIDPVREDFAALSREYHGHYREEAKSASLQEGALDLLRDLAERGCRQVLLSAGEAQALKRQVAEHGLVGFFEDVVGADDNQAFGKVGKALAYFNNAPAAGEALLIGDTYHDYETAAALGRPCLLVRNGHQNLDRFRFGRGVSLVSSLIEANELALNQPFR
jgi:phosphoglycolate phosphatase